MLHRPLLDETLDEARSARLLEPGFRQGRAAMGSRGDASSCPTKSKPTTNSGKAAAVFAAFGKAHDVEIGSVHLDDLRRQPFPAVLVARVDHLSDSES